jgi:hypothetical protein
MPPSRRFAANRLSSFTERIRLQMRFTCRLRTCNDSQRQDSDVVMRRAARATGSQRCEVGRHTQNEHKKLGRRGGDRRRRRHVSNDERSRACQRRPVGPAAASPDIPTGSGWAASGHSSRKMLEVRARRGGRPPRRRWDAGIPAAVPPIRTCTAAELTGPSFLSPHDLRPSQGDLSDVLGRRYSKSSANSRASCSLSTDGPDPGSRLPATSGVNKRVTAPTNPAKISMYAGTMALPVPDTKA